MFLKAWIFWWPIEGNSRDIVEKELPLKQSKTERWKKYAGNIFNEYGWLQDTVNL